MCPPPSLLALGQQDQGARSGAVREDVVAVVWAKEHRQRGCASGPALPFWSSTDVKHVLEVRKRQDRRQDQEDGQEEDVVRADGARRCLLRDRRTLAVLAGRAG